LEIEQEVASVYPVEQQKPGWLLRKALLQERLALKEQLAPGE
jgi:hypothetical protein